jgi:hypothetical protein
MLQTVEAEMDANGNIRLLEPPPVTTPRRVLVTFLEPIGVTANSAEANAALTDAAQEVRRQQQMEWLKANAEEYGGQYVALVSGELISTGKTFRAANEAAIAVGRPNVFVTYLPKPDEVLEVGGWA